MPNKDLEKRREAGRKYYHRNKEKISEKRKKDLNLKERVRKRRSDNVEVIREKDREYQKKRYLENKDKINQSRKKRRQTAKGRFEMLKAGAKKRGLDFDINFEKYCDCFWEKSCVYCGETSKGIDRIDSNLGYIDGNMVSCCYLCNVMKTDQSIESFQERISKIFHRMNEWGNL